MKNQRTYIIMSKPHVGEMISLRVSKTEFDDFRAKAKASPLVKTRAVCAGNVIALCQYPA